MALAAGLREAGINVEVACEAEGEGLDAILEARGVPVHRLAFTGAEAASGAIRLAGLSRSFDLVHSHLTHATAAAVFAQAVVGRPVVETRHFLLLAHEDRRGPRRMAGRARRAVLDRGVALTLAPSQAVAANVRGPAEVIPHGIDLSRPLPAGHPPATVRRVVTVGRLERDRNHALALRAFAAARPGLGNEALLTVVGDGAERSRLEALAVELGLGQRVVFTGRVPDVCDHLDRADVFVAPAVEAFGLSAAEAMARGLAVVAVDAGGVRELVEHERTGLLAAPEPQAFANALCRLSREPGLATRLGGAAQRRVERELTIERMVERTTDAYRRVTGREATGPKALRVHHSAVVGGWRERDREMRRSGAQVTLVAPRAWREGASLVRLDAEHDAFVVAARTFGHHPTGFVYNPLPIWRLLRRHRFDIVDVHEEPYSVAASEVRVMARLLQPDAKLVLYSAQNLAKRYPWPFRRLEADTLAAAAAVYVCNQAAAGVLRGKGFGGETRLLPLGVDLSRFAPRPESEPPGDPFRVGYVGRLTAVKGVDVLIRAAAEEPTWEVVVAGDGPEASRLEALAETGGVRATFHGSIAHNQLPEHYRRLDVLVVPSQPSPGWLEQFCRVAVEGMASGLPIVASASGALPEVVGDAGLLVPPGDAPALAQALRALADDPAERQRLGRIGRERAARFSWPAVAAAHLELYREVTG